MDATRVEVTFTIPEEPTSKARHKTGIRRGKVYHYKDAQNGAAQDRVGLYYRQARGPGRPAEGGFGVEMEFYVGKRQRRDVDNFVKLVFDGLTGYAWIDDSQVTEMSAKVIHDSDAPRSVVRVYPTDDLPDRMQRDCQHCGTPFRTYASWGTTKKYCSAECRKAAVNLRRERICKHCGNSFHTVNPTKDSPFCSTDCKWGASRVEVECAECGVKRTIGKAQHTPGRHFCDMQCQSEFWRKRRAKGAEGSCSDCGGSTSKKSYTRCRACYFASKGKAKNAGLPIVELGLETPLRHRTIEERKAGNP